MGRVIERAGLNDDKASPPCGVTTTESVCLTCPYAAEMICWDVCDAAWLYGEEMGGHGGEEDGGTEGRERKGFLTGNHYSALERQMTRTGDPVLKLSHPQQTPRPHSVGHTTTSLSLPRP